jgi:hypothetical protein
MHSLSVAVRRKRENLDDKHKNLHISQIQKESNTKSQKLNKSNLKFFSVFLKVKQDTQTPSSLLDTPIRIESEPKNIKYPDFSKVFC